MSSFTWLSTVPRTRPGAGVASMFSLQASPGRTRLQTFGRKWLRGASCGLWSLPWMRLRVSALVSLLGRVTQSLSWFSGNLCVHRIQFLRGQRISKRPSPVNIWHFKWDGEGIILDGELQGIGEEGVWVGLEPYYSQALDAKSVVVSPSGQAAQWCDSSRRSSDFTPHFLCLSTLVCLYRYGSELRGDIFFILLYFPDSSQ